MNALKREGNERWDAARILGAVIAVLGTLPFLLWLYELVVHVFTAPVGQDFQPALQPGDVWYMTFIALAIGLGFAYGQGRKLTNALIDRIRGHPHRDPSDGS